MIYTGLKLFDANAEKWLYIHDKNLCKTVGNGITIHLNTNPSKKNVSGYLFGMV